MNLISISNMRKRGDVSQHLAVVAVLLGEIAERGIDFRRILLQIDNANISNKNSKGSLGKDRLDSDN